jgi:hypothetical protein
MVFAFGSKELLASPDGMAYAKSCLIVENGPVPLSVIESEAFSVNNVSDQPTSRSYRFVMTSICLYIFTSIALVPVGSLRLPDIPALTPSLGTAILFTDISTGFLLFVTFYQERRLSLMLLGCAYLSVRLRNIVGTRWGMLLSRMATCLTV